MEQKPERIGIFVSYSGAGGVERMMNNLAQGILDSGYGVDMVLARSQGGHLASLPKDARVFDLGKKHTLAALPGLINYLKEERPAALLAAKHRAIKVAVLARLFSRSDVFLAGRIGTTVSAALEGRSRIRKIIWHADMKLFYRFADLIIAVSGGVAKDVGRITSLPPDRISVIRNPVVTQQLGKLASEPVAHPWYSEPGTPVIIGIGRLTRQKDFATLIKAFAKVRGGMKCRLIILGEGRERTDLENLAGEMGVKNDIDLPGFSENPFSSLSRSSLFVLSSRWEGSPNALTEALALGTPVVSTDCLSGPREILQDGKYGELVPVGDVDAMASAIIKTLKAPVKDSILREAVEEFTVRTSSQNYIEAVGLNKTKRH